MKWPTACSRACPNFRTCQGIEPDSGSLAPVGGSGFANNCLLARRMVERGVRFVQLFDQGWDHHSSVFGRLSSKCKQVDQPIAALIKDLKERGLLDETLVVWRPNLDGLPWLRGRMIGEKTRVGRDHHKEAHRLDGRWRCQTRYAHGRTNWAMESTVDRTPTTSTRPCFTSLVEP